MDKRDKSVKINLIKSDPFFPTFNDVPRPGFGAENVPVKTSFCIQLSIPDDTSDSVDFDSVTVSIRSGSEEPFLILNKGSKFAPGYYGRFIEKKDYIDKSVFIVYIDSDTELKPLTTYAVTVTAASKKGALLTESDGSWSFTTAAAQSVSEIEYTLDIGSEQPVKWHGQLFSGLNRPDFCSRDLYFNPERYSLFKEARKEYPKAWTLMRDFSVTGFEHRYKIFGHLLANIVREKETRRIVSIERNEEGALLRLEDFFGHEQYNIESNRPVSDDYKKGDEVLIADGLNSARAFVIKAYDEDNTVLVTDFADPAGGWEIEYPAPLPEKEDPRCPGLFPTGGTYLRKFNPVGTPCYYWGRLDHEWDNMHGKYGFRMVVGFFDAPGDLSIDGNSWTYPKDYAQLHKAIYDIASHIIERYGDAVLDWYWSALLEPDLSGAYWRTKDWNIVLKYYDYMSDAVLRAFEDHGYNSEDVMIGGFELGGITGTKLRLEEILVHCSPTASKPGVPDKNAAYADPRLDGKRSKLVEKLCSANNGKGVPVKFISVHTYDASDLAAAKLIKAKEMALEVDPEYYNELWITDFESVPDWSGIKDPGAAECYLGNGYFATWIADFVRRMLQQAKNDPRFSYGESIFTIWPFPNHNFYDLNDLVRAVHIDDNGDHKRDCTVIIPTPEFHLTNLLSSMGNDFWVLPEKVIDSHTISGFASQGDNDIKMMFYSHDVHDPQSRSDDSFDLNLCLKGVRWRNVRIKQYRFDKRNNTYYELAKELRQKPGNPNYYLELMLGAETDDSQAQLYTPEELKLVEDQAALKVTKQGICQTDSDNTLRFTANIAANGVNFVVIEPEL